MCTRFVYRGDNIITGFNFDIDIVEWNHKVINTKDCFYIGIMRPDGMRHSYHGVNRNGNVGTLLYVHGNLSGTYQDFVLLGLILSVVCVRSKESRSVINIASTAISAFWALLMVGIVALAVFLTFVQ